MTRLQRVLCVALGLLASAAVVRRGHRPRARRSGRRALRRPTGAHCAWFERAREQAARTLLRGSPRAVGAAPRDGPQHRRLRAAIERTRHARRPVVIATSRGVVYRVRTVWSRRSPGDRVGDHAGERVRGLRLLHAVGHVGHPRRLADAARAGEAGIRLPPLPVVARARRRRRSTSSTVLIHHANGVHWPALFYVGARPAAIAGVTATWLIVLLPLSFALKRRGACRRARGGACTTSVTPSGDRAAARARRRHRHADGTPGPDWPPAWSSRPRPGGRQSAPEARPGDGA